MKSNTQVALRRNFEKLNDTQARFTFRLQPSGKPSAEIKIEIAL